VCGCERERERPYVNIKNKYVPVISKIFMLVDADMRMIQSLLQSKLGRQQGSTYKIARIQSVE
jgi:hypothetical protein